MSVCIVECGDIVEYMRMPPCHTQSHATAL